jgi:hypothetical protein
MNKIPVFDTVSRSYGFLLGEFGTVARLAWAPLLLGAGVSYIYGGAAMDAAIEATTNSNPAAAAAYAPVQFLIGIVGFVTGIIAEVALLRVIVFGDRKPGLFVYLWLGGSEFRLILVTLLLAVAIVAGAVGLGLVLGILAALSAAVPVMGVVLVLAMLGVFVAIIWAALRLTLIAPIVVAENSLGVERSWALMRGNALRMLAVLFLTFAPLAIVAFVVSLGLLGSDLPPFPSLPELTTGQGADSAATKEAAEAFAKAVETWQVGLMKAMRAHWAAFCALNFFGNLISTALWASALGGAYRAIVGEGKH